MIRVLPGEAQGGRGVSHWCVCLRLSMHAFIDKLVTSVRERDDQALSQLVGLPRPNQ